MWKQFIAITASFLSLAAAADENWRLHGGTETGQRFSPLDQINQQTVSRLGLVWGKELGTTRGLEATPIVEDGVICTTGAWSVVFAFKAKTGQVKWTYDPKVSRERAYFFCCDAVNRGVALHSGKVYLGTLDGRLIALDHAPESRCGASKPPIPPRPIPSRRQHASRKIRWSSATGARSTECAAISPLMTPKPESRPGASTRSPVIRKRVLNRKPCKKPPRPGAVRIGGKQAEEARHGKA